VAPVGLAVELGVSAVFVSAWSAIGNYINLVLGKQYKCNQTNVYIPAEPLCQADFHPSTRDFSTAAGSRTAGVAAPDNANRLRLNRRAFAHLD